MQDHAKYLGRKGHTYGRKIEQIEKAVKLVGQEQAWFKKEEAGLFKFFWEGKNVAQDKPWQCSWTKEHVYRLLSITNEVEIRLTLIIVSIFKVPYCKCLIFNTRTELFLSQELHAYYRDGTDKRHKYWELGNYIIFLDEVGSSRMRQVIWSLALKLKDLEKPSC